MWSILIFFVLFFFFLWQGKQSQLLMVFIDRSLTIIPLLSPATSATCISIWWKLTLINRAGGGYHHHLPQIQVCKLKFVNCGPLRPSRRKWELSICSGLIVADQCTFSMKEIEIFESFSMITVEPLQHFIQDPKKSGWLIPS